jgi:hypothetical protein
MLGWQQFHQIRRQHMSDFWIKWLKACSLIIIAAGALFAVVDLPVIGRPAQLFVDFCYFRLFGTQPVQLSREALFATSITGALTVGWGLFMHQTIEPLARTHAALLRRTVGLAFTVWYVLDQAGSWRNGAYGNLISNTLFYAAFMLPLLVSAQRSQSTARA